MHLRISPAAEAHVRAGHPWLFSESIRDQNRPGDLGELAVIYDRRDRFLALGLFDPTSPIRVRLLHSGSPQNLDAPWWEQHLQSAIGRREAGFDSDTNAYRLIHGENDGWPGLVLDRYDKVLVLKLYTGAWLPRLGEIVGLMERLLRPEAIVLRLSRNLQELAATRFNCADGQILTPRAPAEDHWFRQHQFLESGLVFEADLRKGQKTGFFLDQRENRRQVERLAGGREVLNAFSFSGGFSLYAARGGAKSVTDLDLSPHALESARCNFALNRHLPGIEQCSHQTVQANAFEWLQTDTGGKFDLIVLDPPSLARREAERAGAIQAYQRLAEAALKRLRARGILVAASCSAHVAVEEFFGSVLTAARRSTRPFQELARTGHPADHPATFPEAQYLKCIYLSFASRPGGSRSVREE